PLPIRKTEAARTAPAVRVPMTSPRRYLLKPYASTSFPLRVPPLTSITTGLRHFTSSIRVWPLRSVTCIVGAFGLNRSRYCGWAPRPPNRRAGPRPTHRRPATGHPRSDLRGRADRRRRHRTRHGHSQRGRRWPLEPPARWLAGREGTLRSDESSPALR